MSQVYIVGGGQTKFGELWSESVDSLAAEAIEKALDVAKMRREEIEAVFVGNMLLQQLEQRAQVGKVIAQAGGLYNCPAYHLEAACASGGLAVNSAFMAIKSGMFKNVLVVGVEKMTDVPTEVISRALMGAGSEQEQQVGATFPALYSLITRAYQEKYKVSDEELAVFGVLAHRWAATNPWAQFRQQISVEDVMKSALITDKIRLLNASPVSDGAAGIVLSSEPRCSQVEVVSSAVGGVDLELCQREDLTCFESTKRAMSRALLMANLSTKDVEAIEVHDCFSVAEAIAIEDMGLCQKGDSVNWIQKTGIGVNRSGGLKGCGHPVGATGVKQVWALSSMMTEEDWGVGVCQNVGGTGATSVINILKRERSDGK